jgi:hypothetical protein
MENTIGLKDVNIPAIHETYSNWALIVRDMKESPESEQKRILKSLAHEMKQMVDFLEKLS